MAQGAPLYSTSPVSVSFLHCLIYLSRCDLVPCHAVLRALSSRLAQRMGEAEEHIAAERAALKQDMQEGRFVTKAAFVTFNTERMRDTVIEAMPSGGSTSVQAWPRVAVECSEAL